jgi:hypothetical protein
MENHSHISGNPDARGEARGTDEVVTPEHGKTPAVTEIAILTDSELPETAPAGMRTASVFCNVMSTVWPCVSRVRLKQETTG